MDDDGALWGRYFQQSQLKGSLGMQLMPNVGERVTMPFLSGGHGRSYAHPECSTLDYFPHKGCILSPKSIPDLSSTSIDYTRELWCRDSESGKILHGNSGSHHEHSNRYAALLPEDTVAAVGNSATLQMLQLVDPSKDQRVDILEEPGVPLLDITPMKKRCKGQGRFLKEPKPKRTKKAIAPTEESTKSSGKKKSAKKSLNMVINGIELDLLEIPAPLCTCTGHPQQCYRWGAGGWQSACCTTSISVYPLPMSTKRRGARISGRKMSLGAFRKVLEKLAGEGQDFSSPINLKPFWAKHGTNKFVTIR